MDFAKQGGGYLALWSLPFFCVVTALATFAKEGQRIAGQFTGLIPFAFLIVGLFNESKDLLSLLEPGAYGGVFLGLVLIVLSSRLK